jgi:hypothetical protein
LFRFAFGVEVVAEVVVQEDHPPKVPLADLVEAAEQELGEFLMPPMSRSK